MTTAVARGGKAPVTAGGATRTTSRCSVPRPVGSRMGVVASASSACGKHRTRATIRRAILVVNSGFCAPGAGRGGPVECRAVMDGPRKEGKELGTPAEFARMAAETAEEAAEEAEAAAEEAMAAAYASVNALRTQVVWSPPEGRTQAIPDALIAGASLLSGLGVSLYLSFAYLSYRAQLEVLPGHGLEGVASSPQTLGWFGFAAVVGGVAISVLNPSTTTTEEEEEGIGGGEGAQPAPRMMVYRRSVDEEGSPLLPGRFFLDSTLMDPADIVEEAGIRLAWEVGSSVVPHPDKVDKGGEDSFFISPSVSMIGVADGVSGWASRGIDSALYSRSLCRNAARAASASAGANPTEALLEAFNKTTVEGSSTACLLQLDGQRLLGANLGDSGFRVVRDGRVVLASPVQCHKFNTPFQLSWPEFNESNFPEESDEFDVILAPGDVVVLGTDGLFDNFFDDDIARVVRDAGGGAAAIASDLAAEASSKSKDEGYLSPFILDAIDAGYSQDL
eukprot:CAMPEP_0182891880 /NCGR_PEP_ID=MMETSP0034_2-20130328/23529_1 /TAXON_ID=156128 /ORGANISM="Nephroselmis pyriformis, Strain CCMP717" /LENGTH=504 /DNA_ID=CAMNT_0025025515 /DNA_START=41 /DNA_END=1551 /DNA_ORIENTATION=-